MTKIAEFDLLNLPNSILRKYEGHKVKIGYFQHFQSWNFHPKSKFRTSRIIKIAVSQSEYCKLAYTGLYALYIANVPTQNAFMVRSGLVGHLHTYFHFGTTESEFKYANNIQHWP